MASRLDNRCIIRAIKTQGIEMNNQKFGYEIDFLPVGDGGSGDAIAVRYGNPGNYKVMVIDGGTKESGKQLVEHIRKYYETNFVDYVVNTHPDKDHASGLTEVLQNLDVGELWLHRPWHYIRDIMNHINQNSNLILDGRVTEDSLRRKFEDEYYRYAKELEDMALDRGIAMDEPYTGCQIGSFYVLSPYINWYLFDLIVNSDKTEDIKILAAKEKLFHALKDISFNIAESFGLETLREGGKTSNENESSVILYTKFNCNGILLTGDAGNIALNRAYNYAISCDVDISQNLKFIQIPHHGSRRNVSPSILDKIVGSRGKQPKESISAFVSVGENDPKHPRRVVTNAFIRRGCKVIETKGSAKRHRDNMPDRVGWIAAEPAPFYSKVESYD